MQLDAPDLENDVVRLEVFGGERHKALLKESGAVDDMWRWMAALPGGVNFESYYQFITDAYKAKTIIPFAVFRKSDDAFAGVIGFSLFSRTHRRVRIAYTWHPDDMRGTLIFPAAQRAMIGRALDWGARRIAWTVDIRNGPARRAFERIGAVHEGTLRNFMRMTDGEWADHDILSMTRDEAKAAVSHIDEMIAAGRPYPVKAKENPAGSPGLLDQS